jgi:hypothetical protein
LRHPRKLIPTVLTAALALAACGGEDETSEPAAAEAGTDSTADTEDADVEAGDGTNPDEAPADGSEEAPGGDDDATEPVGSEAVGTVTVAGTEYAISEVRRCEPLDEGGIERELELQGFGQSPDGERVQIDVYQQSIGGAPFDDVSWAGPEGVFGGPDDADLTVDGDEVSGSATLVDAMTQEESVAVSFTLPIPSDELACR